jgi:hypothetical protein
MVMEASGGGCSHLCKAFQNLNVAGLNDVPMIGKSIAYWILKIATTERALSQKRPGAVQPGKTPEV